MTEDLAKRPTLKAVAAFSCRRLAFVIRDDEAGEETIATSLFSHVCRIERRRADVGPSGAVFSVGQGIERRPSKRFI